MDNNVEITPKWELLPILRCVPPLFHFTWVKIPLCKYQNVEDLTTLRTNIKPNACKFQNSILSIVSVDAIYGIADTQELHCWWVLLVGLVALGFISL